jgi:hypothetical protein
MVCLLKPDWMSAIAESATAIFALVALVFAVWQVRVTKRSASQANSVTVWRDYELLAMKHPEFHGICQEQLDFKCLSLNGDRNQFTSYGWYVSFMCWACEAVLETFPKNKDWRESTAAQLSFHRAYLFSEWFETIGRSSTFQPEFRKLFERERSKYRLRGSGSIKHA